MIKHLLLGFYVLEKIKDFYLDEREIENASYHPTRILGTLLSANILFILLFVFSIQNIYILLGIAFPFGFAISFLINDDQIQLDYEHASSTKRVILGLIAFAYFIGSGLMFVFLT
jgi:predicted MFS family arabinose efflux permease